MDCAICEKHQDFGRLTGEIICERGGLVITHFPDLGENASERATRGHLLLEPRRHIVELFEMNAAESAALGPLVVGASMAMKSVLGCEHVYFFRINDKVKHLHFHLIPRYVGTPREYWGTRIMEYPDAPKIRLREIAEISTALKNFDASLSR